MKSLPTHFNNGALLAYAARAIAGLFLLCLPLASHAVPRAPFATLAGIPSGGPYYVAVDGDNAAGDGSLANPWATITHALDSVPDGSEILVLPGLYEGRVRLRGAFSQGVTVRSETPYLAILQNGDRVVTAYSAPGGVSGITLQGFEIRHSAPGAAPLVVHVDGGGSLIDGVSHITLRDNILHDSHDNDLLKINNAARDVLVEGNLFYNQSGSDEHIDVNSVENVTIQDNVFFNDFPGSGRANGNDTGSFIVIKDSNAAEDIFTGSSDITVRRNVFLNWQGSTGANFLLAGEDGQDFIEGRDILVENNLMLGNLRAGADLGAVEFTPFSPTDFLLAIPTISEYPQQPRSCYDRTQSTDETLTITARANLR